MEDIYNDILESFKIDDSLPSTGSESDIVGEPVLEAGEIKGSVKDIVTKIATTLNMAGAKRQIAVRALSDEINTTHNNITSILKGSIGTNGAKEYTITYYDFSIYHKKNKKLYAFQYASVFVPFYQIMKMVTNAIDRSSNSESALNDVKKEVKNFLDNYYWYVKLTEPIAKERKSTDQLSYHIKSLSTVTNNIYKILYGETNTITNEINYTMFIKKAYAECERNYSEDKKAMKIVDEIFNLCLEYTEDAINFNNIASEILFKGLKSYEEQLAKIYKDIK